MADHADLEIGREERDGATVLSPVGDIDLSRSPSLRESLVSAVDARPKKVVLDLDRVEYMDSSGVATLVEAMQVARRASVDFSLCRMQERVRSIFEIARLDTVFTIKDSLEDALA